MIDAQRMRQVLGPLEFGPDEMRDFVAAVESPAPAAVRVRPGAKRDQLPFPVRPVAWHPRGLVVDAPERPATFIEYAAGDYYVQDAGSLLAVSLLDAHAGERICDLCAAPGGKSTAILESLGLTGWLLSNETSPSRGAALALNLARHGSARYVLSNEDPQRLAQRLGALFDAVLVDAPCSGQSLVGRGKQTLSAFEQRTVEFCAARQMRILEAAARLVRPGGRLVYSTCTFAYAENEGLIQSFLNRFPAWRLMPCPAMAGWQSPVLEGCYRLWPHRAPTAGAFAAAMYRSSADAPNRRTALRPRIRLEPARLPAGFSDWGSLDDASVWSDGTRVVAWPDRCDELLTVAKFGPEVSFRKRVTWFPAYALAMRRHADWLPAGTFALDDQQARDYVQGRPVRTQAKGWAVATWRERPLGWIKGDGRLGKNHLPKSARLVLPSKKRARPDGPATQQPPRVHASANAHFWSYNCHQGWDPPRV